MSSTGSDTSATFTITWAAAPLPTTISGVNGSTITLASPSVQTVSGATEWAAWGHDDAPAINAALAAGVGAVLIPTNRTLGVYSGLSAPAATRLDLQCDSATIVALAPMSSMFTDPQNAGFFSSEGSTIERCRLDGMGVAQQNVNHQNFIWFFRDNVFRNATVGNLNVNGHGENSIFQSNQYENDLTIVGAYPQYNKSVNYTDNHFTDEIESGAVNNVYDNTAGSYYTNDHGYYATGPNFVLNGGFKADQLYADGIASNVPGIEVFGTYANIKGWTAYVSYGTGQIGAYIATQNGFNTINGGLAQGIANANVIAVGWGQRIY